MFSEIFAKVSTYASHHQLLFTIIVATCIICASWSIEQILDRYIFHQKKLAGYITTIIIALLILWIVQHFVLHVI